MAEISALASERALGWLLVSSLLLLVAAVVYGWLGAGKGRQLKQRLDAANSEIIGMRQRDPLTGLITRTEFETLLDTQLGRVDRGLGHVALLYLGLDNFGAINDAYGLRVGDALLVEAGGRLSAFMGDRPDVARVAGDEFVLLLRTDLDGAIEAATAVRKVMGEPFNIEAQQLQLSVSVGMAVYPDDGARPRILAHAALAMRTVKMGGGAGYARYSHGMGVNHRDQADLLLDLRQALARHEMELYFQPKVDAHTLQVTAAEALLRWQHPKRGMISPDIFVPLAERHGLIVPIGLWVIEEACRQAAQWREAGLRMRIAVNISGHQLRGEDLVAQIEASLQRHHIPPERLTCEITETVAMEDTAATREAFERLRRAGLHVSIDDFGTGHSSLATLRRLPAAELKIDRAFVVDLASSQEARSIVRAVVQLAHSLQLRVVAEGVETEVQRDELVSLGCDELQGYLFAKPMSASALALWARGDGTTAASDFSPSLFDPTAPAPLR